MSNFFDRINNSEKWSVGSMIYRTNALPLDANSVFATKADAEIYASTATNAYDGQTIVVVDSTKNPTVIDFYIIDNEKLVKIATETDTTAITALLTKEVDDRSAAISELEESIAGKTTLQKDIKVTTAVGNYTKNSIIKAGTSLEDIFSALFSKSLDPTIKTKPGIQITTPNIKPENSAEVGVSYTPKATATVSFGAYTYDGADTIASGVEYDVGDVEVKITDALGTVKTAFNSTKFSSSTATPSITVSADENVYTDDEVIYTINAQGTHSAGTTIDQTNLGATSDKPVTILSNTVSAEHTISYTGYRNWWYGVITEEDATEIKEFADGAINGLSISRQTFGDYGVALQSGSRLTGAGGSVKTINGITLNLTENGSTGNFGYGFIVLVPNKANVTVSGTIGDTTNGVVFVQYLKAAEIPGVNGENAIPYDAYVCIPATGLGSSKYKISIK